MVLKSFDFFRKIQTEQELTSATGGIFTVISLIIGGILIIMSFQDFYESKYITFLAVKSDDTSYLPLRIDIYLNKMPCQVIEIQFHDELEYLEKNLEKKLEMFKVAEDKTEVSHIRSPNLEEEKSSLKISFQKKLSCRISGILSIPKTPGTLTIKPTYNNLINSVQSVPGDMRMSYKIKTFEFGLGNNTFEFPIAHQSKNVENYIKELQGNIWKRQYVQDFTTDNSIFNYYNHVKIIPIVIEHSKQNIQSGDKYRYSLRAGKGPQTQVLPQIQFFTQIQPINIVYRKEEPVLYDLIVKILAVVGGSVASIGILNLLSHYIFSIK